jgi:hypothetical protein
MNMAHPIKHSRDNLIHHKLTHNFLHFLDQDRDYIVFKSHPRIHNLNHHKEFVLNVGKFTVSLL